MEEVGKGVDSIAEEERDWNRVKHRVFGRVEAEMESVAGRALRRMVEIPGL